MALFSKIKETRGIRYVLAYADKTILPGLNNLSVYEIAKRVKRQIREDNIIERASAISFNFTMAMPPTIIFLFTLIPFLPINQQFLNEVYAVIRSIIPDQKNHRIIIKFLEDFRLHPRNGLLSVGFLLSLFFSSNAMMGIMRSFDKDFPGFIKRKGLRKRAVAIRITLILFLVFLVCISLMVAQGQVLDWLGVKNIFVKGLIRNTRWIFVMSLFFFIISYIYKMAPSIEKRWKLITPGSILATILMLLGALGFSWWISNFGNYNKLYGSLGTLLAIMALIFINSLILLIGFEVNVSVYAHHTKEHRQARPDNI